MSSEVHGGSTEVDQCRSLLQNGHVVSLLQLGSSVWSRHSPFCCEMGSRLRLGLGLRIPELRGRTPGASGCTQTVVWIGLLYFIVSHMSEPTAQRRDASLRPWHLDSFVIVAYMFIDWKRWPWCTGSQGFDIFVINGARWGYSDRSLLQTDHKISPLQLGSSVWSRHSPFCCEMGSRLRCGCRMRRLHGGRGNVTVRMFGGAKVVVA